MSSSISLAELVEVMERIAPTAHAEEWDNVGLIAGDWGQTVSRVMLAIDFVPAVLTEATEEKAQAVIAYHPPIFKAVSRLTSPHVVYEAIRRGMAIYSPHTALDVAPGGTNDCLADAVGMTERSPIRTIREADQLKLVTFVPAEHVDAVSAAMFAAGAGRIGKYTSCSFRMQGTGTFFGTEGTNPAVGKSGRLEEVSEIRLETVVPEALASAVVAALRTRHPYEEPAFDLVRLAGPESAIGMGRIGMLESLAPREEVIERVKRAAEVSHVLLAGPRTGLVKKVAVCAGSCGSVLDAAIAQGGEVFVTGEIRHHDALRAQSAGITVICMLHSNSERLALTRLRDRLAAELASVEFVLSQMDRDPLTVV